jgi:osmotically-inducible protein OsmY
MSTTTESLGGTLGRPDLTTLDQYDTESDRRLIQQIRQVLSDDQDLIKESLQNLRIRASQGEVTLEGPVPSQADKDRIAHRVQQVAGAAQVDNRLEVSGSSSWEGTDTR